MALSAKLLLGMLLVLSTVAVAQPQDWLAHVQRLVFGERLTQIGAVSQLPKAV